MLLILTCAIIALSSLTPKEWLDPRLDTIDREAIEEMISFSIPPFHEDVEWVLQEGDEPPVWESLRGRVLVIQTWSNQSASGRVAPFASQKIIDGIEQKEEVVLITLHTPQGANKAKQFIQKRKLTALTAIDNSGETCNHLGVYYDPVTIIVDRSGAVRHAGLRTRGLSKAIQSLLAEEYDPAKVVEKFVPKRKPVEVKVGYPPFSDNYGNATNVQGKKAPRFFVEEWISEPLDVENKMRVVEFWATWCPPCRKSIPHLNELAAHFGDKVAFVGVSGESAEKVTAFQKKTPMKYGVAIDSGKKMQNKISCRAIPLALVIGSDNKVRWQGNPSMLTKSIIDQVLRADSGETETVDRGRWKLNKQSKK